MRKFLLIAYGTEIEFYTKTIDLWKLRNVDSSGWSLITYRLAPNLNNELFEYNDGELLIAEHPELVKLISEDPSRFSLSGNWSEFEKIHHIYRRIMMSRFLLDFCAEGFIAYFISSTSVINLNLLNWIDFDSPKSKFVAGQFMTANSQGRVFWFPSGSGFITNRCGVSLFACQTQLAPVYDDVWTGMILQGFERLRFPRLDITHPIPRGSEWREVYLRRVERAFESGIWHVRLKLQDNRITDFHLERQIDLLSDFHNLASVTNTVSALSRSLVSNSIVSDP